MGFSLVVVSGSYSLVPVCGLLLAVPSLVAERGLQERGLSGCRARALEYRLSSHGVGAWLRDLSASGIEPKSPALAGGFLSTVSPGKPLPFSLEEPIINPDQKE